MQAKREWAFQNMVNHPKAGKLCVVYTSCMQDIATTDSHGLLMNFANLFIIHGPAGKKHVGNPALR